MTEQGGRDDVYAAEGIFLVFTRPEGEALRFGLLSVFVDPSAEPRLAVEQQVAGCLPLADEQGRFVGCMQVVSEQSFQVGV